MKLPRKCAIYGPRMTGLRAEGRVHEAPRRLRLKSETRNFGPHPLIFTGSPDHAGCLEPRDAAVRASARLAMFFAYKIESFFLTSFHDFGLADPINRSLAEQNYTQPTPIQAQTIPLALTGRDVVGIAQTGTGKTAAFALPILHRSAANRLPLQKKSCRVLVLSPTRELSGADPRQLPDLWPPSAYFGNARDRRRSDGPQVRALMSGVDVLVATPGRLLDLVRATRCASPHVEFLVLDEADRMLDMGFIHDIRKIVAKLPKSGRRCSSRRPCRRRSPSSPAQMLRDPARVAVTPQAHDRRARRAAHRPSRQGIQAGVLAELLKAEPIDRALVFTRTKHGADKVVRGLVQSRHPRRSDPRQQVAGSARAGARRVPQGRRAHAGRDRHRRARHRRRRHQPCVQLRPAQRAGKLCSPHRPHRARRRHRHRDLVLRFAKKWNISATSRS